MTIHSLARTAGALLLAALGLSACDIQTYEEAADAFNNNTQDGASPPPASPPPPPPPPAGASFGPVFSEIQSGLFDSCASACHSGVSPPGNLDLSSNASYMMLVGMPSDADATVNRVEPGQPDQSYLVLKLEGVDGDPPHPSGSPVSQADIDSIRVWIADGAIDDTAPPAQAAIQVASVLPAPDATLASPPPNITVGFTKDLDPSTVNSLTLQLIGAGGDGLFSNGNEVTITAAGISVPVSNPRAAIFDLTGVTMNDDGYRFSILGTGGNLVLDMDGLALDGEYTNRFPSGDGAEGGDFEADFTVATPVTLEPNLQSIQELVFTPGCATSGCHRGVMPSADLDLSDAMTSYTELVGVASSVVAGRTLVVANDSANSYLVEKLGPDPTAGQQMPVGQPPLSSADIDVIRQWIDTGANPP